MRRAVLTAACIAAPVFAAMAIAQPTTLAFDVTFVKANRTGDRSSRFQLLPGWRFLATNTTVRALLQAGSVQQRSRATDHRSG